MQDEVTQALEYSRMADPEAWVNADAGKHSPENNARLAQANTTGKARYLFELLAGFSQSQFVQAAASEGGENLLNALVGVLGGFPAHRHQAERETLARMEWRDAAKDAVPKDGTRILVRNDRGTFTVEWDEDCIDGWWVCPDGKHDDQPLRGGEPTHWMPLPPAPEAGQ